MAVRHTIRKPGGGIQVVTLTARRAIISMCRECMGHVATEVRGCTDIHCPLFPFRTHDTPRGTVE